MLLIEPFIFRILKILRLFNYSIFESFTNNISSFSLLLFLCILKRRGARVFWNWPWFSAVSEESLNRCLKAFMDHFATGSTEVFELFGPRLQAVTFVLLPIVCKDGEWCRPLVVEHSVGLIRDSRVAHCVRHRRLKIHCRPPRHLRDVRRHPRFPACWRRLRRSRRFTRESHESVARGDVPPHYKAISWINIRAPICSDALEVLRRRGDVHPAEFCFRWKSRMISGATSSASTFKAVPLLIASSPLSFCHDEQQSTWLRPLHDARVNQRKPRRLRRCFSTSVLTWASHCTWISIETMALLLCLSLKHSLHRLLGYSAGKSKLYVVVMWLYILLNP